MNKLQTERIDVANPIRSMSYNVPGHGNRVEAHCKRVQREYFDSGLHYKETHKAQEKSKLMRDGRSHD